ncbi:MAG: hypothetical protein EBY41_07265, partial [Proteobacteria bacterium]|nr:hypothetical protein [Pseudomonadota bacterium]
LNSTNTTTISAAIGSGTNITSLTTDSGGTTVISADITSTGNQTYNDAVILRDNIILTGSTIYTLSTITGNNNSSDVSAQGTSGWIDSGSQSLSTTATYNDGTNGSETILAGLSTYAKYQTINSLSSDTYTVTFNWYRIDSWDGEDLEITVNNVKIVDKSFSSSQSDYSSAQTPAGTTAGYSVDITNRKSSGNSGDYIRYGNDRDSWVDQSFVVTITTPTITSLDLIVRTTLDQEVSDESFGLKDFALSRNNPEVSLSIVGNLDAEGAITGLTTLSVSGTSSLDNDVTSTSTQGYTGNVTLTNDVVLTTTNSQITFTGTVDSEATEANDLTISVGTSEVEFDGAVGGNAALGAISITGALDLDANITSAS